MTSTAECSPRQLLVARLADNEALARHLAARSTRLSLARGAALVLLLALGLLATETERLSSAWLALPGAIFASLVVIHRRVAIGEALARRRATFYRAGVERLDGRWVGRGTPGDNFKTPEHLYAEDLDIFGRGSLFELLCTSRTGSGERELARWLCEAAPPELIARRQAAVLELRPQLPLRERLALIGEAGAATASPEPLERWAANEPHPLGSARQLTAVVLSAAATTALTGWLAFGWSAAPALLAVVALAVFARVHRAWTQQVLAAMRQPARTLGLVSELLELVEQLEVAADELVAIKADLVVEGRPASAHIARLRRLGVLADSGANMLFAPFAALLLWQLHVASAVERWRSACGPQLARWFSALGRFEACSAIAGYSWEHPEDPFPEIVDTSPLFVAEGLAHPLLPRRQAVANDLGLDGSPAALIVSGSNMSGKSTLLRAVGVNAVLAQAGAPVCAHRLRMSPLAVGASIATHDSLLEGRSRFFAEISRLQQITQLCGGERPVLFLLDEVLHGTNSHDRRIGAEQLLRFLVGQGALGLMTTHDLALAAIADALAPQLANVHFRDTLESGGMVFDFRLRPGTVTTSNALALMRQVGLPVEG